MCLDIVNAECPNKASRRYTCIIFIQKLRSGTYNGSVISCWR